MAKHIAYSLTYNVFIVSKITFYFLDNVDIDFHKGKALYVLTLRKKKYIPPPSRTDS